MFGQARLCVRDYAPGASMAPHQHEEASLSLVVHGNFLEKIGREKREYLQGHVAFFPAAMSHAQRFGSLGARQVTFRPDDSWIDYLADCKVAIASAPHAHGTIFRRLGDRLLEEIKLNDAFSSVACEGLMLEVVAALGRGARPKRVGSRPPAWLRTAHDYIRENALHPLPLSDIAAVAGRHDIHLVREFRRHYGMTIGAYIRRLRIEHVALRLQQGQATLSEIALESGFSSHAHLCREFKAQLGITPSQYRYRC